MLLIHSALLLLLTSSKLSTNASTLLVNNAGASGFQIEGDISVFQDYIDAELATYTNGGKAEEVKLKANGKLVETLDWAEECIQTNYYGNKFKKTMNIVVVSLLFQLLSNEWAKGVLSDEEGLTEERIDEVVHRFLNHFKEGSLEVNNWPRHMAAYKVSKAALNAYTRIAAKKHPTMRINSVCPGFAKTDITYNLGFISSEEAAQVVLKLALLPDSGPSGSIFNYFQRQEVLSLY